MLEKLCFLKNVCDLIYRAIQNISETLCDVFKQKRRNTLSLKSDGFYLQNKRIISKKARIQYVIFTILVEQRIDDFWNQKKSYISPKAIQKILEEKDICLTEKERNK